MTFRKQVGYALLVWAALGVVAAIWVALGAWWQWLATAVVLLLVGAPLAATQSTESKERT